MYIYIYISIYTAMGLHAERAASDRISSETRFSGNHKFQDSRYLVSAKPKNTKNHLSRGNQKRCDKSSKRRKGHTKGPSGRP